MFPDDRAVMAAMVAKHERLSRLPFHRLLRERYGMQPSGGPKRVIGRIEQPFNTWLGREVTMQGDLWVTIDGRVIRVMDLDKEHALNVLCFLYESHYEDIVPPRENPLVGALRRRILA